MATLPISDSHILWQVTNIDNEVLILKDPGTPTEKVVYRVDVTYKNRVAQAIKDIRKLNGYLDLNQRIHAVFWLGYFYAHLNMGRRGR